VHLKNKKKLVLANTDKLHKPWFSGSQLLQHLARKCSGFVLRTPEPALGTFTGCRSSV